MRVLVTGGAGFIGSHVADAFVHRGNAVAVVDDLSAGDAGRVSSKVTFSKLSITDSGSLTSAVLTWRPDVICHLAAQVSVAGSVADPAADARTGIVGTVSVLEAALDAGARVIFASSGGALYAREAAFPAAENAAIEPGSPYGAGKLCAEHYVGLYNRLHGTSHCVLRLANVYGTRQEAGVIPAFCARILAGQPPVIYGDGYQTRDFTHISDTARAFILAADRKLAGTWNIGTGTETTVRDLAALIGTITGRPAEPEFRPPQPGDVPRSALDSGLARALLGWRPRITLPAGLRDTLLACPGYLAGKAGTA